MEKATRQYNSKNNIFQSTLPRRERPHAMLQVGVTSRNFNPRSREGSDRKEWLRNYKDWDFNPRSREGSDRKEWLRNYKDWDFNPRSREGSDCFFISSGRMEFISIHAPAKGATFLLGIQINGRLFQSTLPRRERPGSRVIRPRWKYFNPRSREGSDSNISQILKLIL